MCLTLLKSDKTASDKRMAPPGSTQDEIQQTIMLEQKVELLEQKAEIYCELRAAVEKCLKDGVPLSQLQEMYQNNAELSPILERLDAVSDFIADSAQKQLDYAVIFTAFVFSHHTTAEKLMEKTESYIKRKLS